MVSNVHDSDEGWSAVDEIADDAVCNLDQLIGPELTDKHGAALTMSEKVTLRKQSKLPTVVHFCQLYRVGIYMWGKWNPKLQNLFACDQPYLLEPPSHIGTMRLTVSACAMILYLLIQCSCVCACAVCFAQCLCCGVVADAIPQQHWLDTTVHATYNTMLKECIQIFA
jgi:hypothetical protein